MHQVVCFATLLLATFCNADGPVFCGELDCPKYTLENKTDVYQSRCYETYHWASTTITGVQYKQAETKAFMVLYNYISEQNNKHEKIPMAMPVLTQIQHTSHGPFCAANFTVSFFIAFQSQAKPPEPTSHDVHITTLKAFCAYVHSFGGYMKMHPDIAEHFEKLTVALEKDELGDTYHKDYFYAASYDTPYVLYNRHNEIWFIKKKTTLENAEV